MAASIWSEKTGKNLPFSSKMADICWQIKCREQRDYPPWYWALLIGLMSYLDLYKLMSSTIMQWAVKSHSLHELSMVEASGILFQLMDTSGALGCMIVLFFNLFIQNGKHFCNCYHYNFRKTHPCHFKNASIL